MKPVTRGWSGCCFNKMKWNLTHRSIKNQSNQKLFRRIKLSKLGTRRVCVLPVCQLVLVAAWPVSFGSTGVWDGPERAKSAAPTDIKYVLAAPVPINRRLETDSSRWMARCWLLSAKKAGLSGFRPRLKLTLRIEKRWWWWSLHNAREHTVCSHAAQTWWM